MRLGYYFGIHADVGEGGAEPVQPCAMLMEGDTAPAGAELIPFYSVTGRFGATVEVNTVIGGGVFYATRTVVAIRCQVGEGRQLIRTRRTFLSAHNL